MIKRSTNPSALVGMAVCLILLITILTLRGSSLRETNRASAVPRAEAMQAGGQKALTKAAPPISLQDDPAILRDIQNATLGFQRIYVLSMPNRSDKRDALALSAYLSGLELEFVDGVDPSTIPEKAYPQNWKFTPDEPAGTLGCWRGHMNVYRKMLNERIQTAMIWEDDVDWDVMIKAQLTEVARGTRYLQKSKPSSISPYGDDWSLLSTGHCGMWNRIDEDQEYWVVNDDPTVVTPEQRSWWRKPNLTPPAIAGNRSRIVFSPYHFTCFASYGISISGAARAVYDQAVLPHAEAIDMGVGKICRRREYGLNTCLGTYPMITGVHRQAGSQARDSDRTDKKNGRPDRKYASSDHLNYPVRLNLGQLLKGETLIRAQDPRHSLVEEIDIATMKLPRGDPVYVTKEEYVKGEPDLQPSALAAQAEAETKKEGNKRWSNLGV